MKQLKWQPTLLAMILSACHPVYAQKLLYDAARDKIAKDAEEAAKKVTATATFNTMLRNVVAQQKDALDTQIRLELEGDRALWITVRYWAKPSTPRSFGGVTVQVCESVRCRIEQPLELDTAQQSQDVQTALQDIEAKRTIINDALKSLKALAEARKAPKPLIEEIDARINQMEEALQFAKDLAALHKSASPDALATSLSTAGQAMDAIRTSFDQIAKLYGIVQGIQQANAAVSIDANALRPNRLETDLRLLEKDEQHFRRIGLIRARSHFLTADAQTNFVNAKRELEEAGVWNSPDSIEETLARTTDPEKVEHMLRGLYYAAASMSVRAGIARVQTVLEAFERRSLSIQHKGVEAMALEQTLVSATQRLSIYWKAGLKPSDIAQLLFSATSAATLPVIAATK